MASVRARPHKTGLTLTAPEPSSDKVVERLRDLSPKELHELAMDTCEGELPHGSSC